VTRHNPNRAFVARDRGVDVFLEDPKFFADFMKSGEPVDPAQDLVALELKRFEVSPFVY
jgi:hypothetical protein